MSKLRPCPVEWHAISDSYACGLVESWKGHPIVFDTETDGLLVRDGQHTAHYLGLLLATAPTHCFIVRAPFSDDLRRALAASLLVGHNARFDAHALGLELTGAAPYDTMLRAYGHSTTTFKSLDDEAPRMGFSKIATPQKILEGRIAEMTTEEVGPYLADDCAVTAALFLRQIKYNGAPGPLALLDFDTERAVLNMERRGVRLLTEDLAELGIQVQHQIRETKEKLQSLGVTSTLNIGSPKQVKALFEGRGVRLPLDAKTGKPSTGKIALEKLDRAGDPLAAAILAARKALKLRDAFLIPLPTHISPKTGLIHAAVKTAHTKTGRFSYADPNLQQIPKHGRIAKQFRSCFTSATGRIAGADFSQHDIRVAAASSGDPRLLEIFANGEDLHRSAAAQILGKAMEAVTKEERFKAKATTLGLLNGMGVKRLAYEIRQPVDDAQRFLDAYFTTFAGLHEWMEGVWRDCESHGLVRTFLGRQRIFGRDDDTRPGLSVKVQGGAADLMRAALVALDRAQMQPILAIHDEIVVDATLPGGGLTRGEEVATVMRDAANALWRETTGSLPVSFDAVGFDGEHWGVNE